LTRPGAGPAFDESVRAVVAATRPGDVITYGEVAAEAGHPGAARAVGTVLRDSVGLPWWRVVRADGRLAAGKDTEQARRLLGEGVAVAGGRVRRELRPGSPPGPPGGERGGRR
jgi:methylated-DNA-protein-cysteine methyltransferase related protein